MPYGGQRPRLSYQTLRLTLKQLRAEIDGHPMVFRHKYLNNWARLEKRAVEDFKPDISRDVIKQLVQIFCRIKK
jgi:hypothetical protein